MMRLGGQRFLTFCVGLLCVQLKHNLLSTLPESFGDLMSLQHLDLSHNDLKIVPDCITGLVHLRTLYLNDNGASVLPDAIGGLVALQNLNVRVFSARPELEHATCIKLLRCWLIGAA